MEISDFDFNLPESQIAQAPLTEREASRMLVINRQQSTIQDAQFTDLPGYLVKGDLLVINNTKVFPARLFGKTDTGAAIEIFLVREMEASVWEALARPGRRLKSGKRVVFDQRLSCTIIDKRDDGKVLINFEIDGDLFEILDVVGVTPLPPYIKREISAIDRDRDRYQTVFAKNPGAIAAPTAGLHFTSKVFDALRQRDIEIIEVTLHVGYGTFEPVRVTRVSDHSVSPERYYLTESAAASLNRAMAENRRIVAVGTTTTRALESSIQRDGRFIAGENLADLTIIPGCKFHVVNALLTNFHLPQSSLLILTSTFGGHQLIMNAYRHAVAAGYRFYSYGDCMLIV